MTQSSSRRCSSDSGAVLVEFALVLPLLALVVFGITEFAFAWQADSRLDSSTATAARVAASAGRLDTADRDTLVALKASLPSDLLAKLDRVVIYRSTTANGSVPSQCVPAVGSPSDVGDATQACNSYSGATVRAVTQTTDLGAKDNYWASSARRDTILGPPDYVGVYVRTTYEDKTGTFWTDIRLTDSSVFRIQPDFTGI